ncbi:hypothetical protein ACWDR1_15310 [Streptosporangium sandarakinum]
MGDAAERIRRLCTAMEDGEFHSLVDEAGAGDVVARLLTAIREAGGDPSALVKDLDALDEAMATLGVGPVTRPERAYRALPGTGRGHPVVHAWTCPAAVPCDRVEVAARDAGPPRCAATDRPLTSVRVRT